MYVPGIKGENYEGFHGRLIYILDQIREYSLDDDPTHDFWGIFWPRVFEECNAIESNQDGVPGIEWTKTNIRYPYNATVPGLIAETIAAINLHKQYGYNIKFATEQKDQVDSTIDFWVGYPTPNQPIQVKAVTIIKDVLTNHHNLMDIKSEMTCLVDIDYYHHFYLPTQVLHGLLAQSNEQRIQLHIDVLEKHSEYYFYNLDIYGTPEDRLVFNKNS